ncbi:hypothetical protein AB0P36_13510 [Streptomyces flavidovirens]|uniref:hypothetical protein n=1 Tax=Streptomyces flavidovirens TaxID=67298 RepID=UPI003415BDC4
MGHIQCGQVDVQQARHVLGQQQAQYEQAMPRLVMRMMPISAPSADSTTVTAKVPVRRLMGGAGQAVRPARRGCRS